MRLGADRSVLRSHLLGVGRLRLEQLTLERVQLDLSIGDHHAAGHRQRQREDHHDARFAKRRGAAPGPGNRTAPRRHGDVRRTATDIGSSVGPDLRSRARTGAAGIDSPRKGNDAHGSFRATRSRAERARGFRSISLWLASRALALNTVTRGTAPQTHPNSGGQ